MPRGPKGQKRLADVIGNAIRVATGEITEEVADDGNGRTAHAPPRVLALGVGTDCSISTYFLNNASSRGGTQLEPGASSAEWATRI